MDADPGSWDRPLVSVSLQRNDQRKQKYLESEPKALGVGLSFFMYYHPLYLILNPESCSCTDHPDRHEPLPVQLFGHLPLQRPGQNWPGDTVLNVIPSDKRHQTSDTGNSRWFSCKWFHSSSVQTNLWERWSSATGCWLTVSCLLCRFWCRKCGRCSEKPSPAHGGFEPRNIRGHVIKR